MSAQPGNRQLLRSALACILPLVVLSVPAAMVAVTAFNLSGWYVGKMLVLLGVGVFLVLRGLQAHHPFQSIGPANCATSARGVLVALLAALPGEQTDDFIQLVALSVGILAAMLDGLDGWLARKAKMSSAFGARFDMETDALLILALSVLAWQFGKAGAWVLLSGVMRYGFVLAGLAFGWLRAHCLPASAARSWQWFRPSLCCSPLHRSFRQCQRADRCLRPHRIGALIPDGYRLAPTKDDLMRTAALLAVVLALVLVNGALTFHNVWPTLGIRWPGELSIELAFLLLALALSNAFLGPTSRRLIGVLAAVLVLFALGRYAEVTAPALYGREINLCWDAQHVSALAGMLTAVAPVWAVAGGALALTAALRSCSISEQDGHFAPSTTHSADDERAARIRRGLRRAHRVVRRAKDGRRRAAQYLQFSIPVSQTYATQICAGVRHVREQRRGAQPAALTAAAGESRRSRAMRRHRRLHGVLWTHDLRPRGNRQHRESRPRTIRGSGCARRIARSCRLS